jgi:hypothetical protein
MSVSYKVSVAGYHGQKEEVLNNAQVLFQQPHPELLLLPFLLMFQQDHLHLPD